jgi:hypothetical protein
MFNEEAYKYKRFYNPNDKIVNNKIQDEENCLHDACPDCNGTGVKKDSVACIHFISCPCSKCNRIRF